jgi:predicted nucleotidyltransferase
MARAQNPNLEILMLAVDRLGELADEMVFLGGCATGLLITDPAASPIRVTRDVDAIVQVVSHADFYKLSEQLRALGFKEDISDDAPICRWGADKVILDVMPTDTQILGFGNKWYAPAMENSQNIELPNGKIIHLVSAPYFLVTKFEAFDGRGGGDYLMSHDIEDIIAVLDGRPEIVNEVRQSEPELAKELSERFQNLLQDPHFVDAVSGHMPTDETSQARVSIILTTMRELAEAK